MASKIKRYDLLARWADAKAQHLQLASCVRNFGPNSEPTIEAMELASFYYNRFEHILEDCSECEPLDVLRYTNDEMIRFLSALED